MKKFRRQQRKNIPRLILSFVLAILLWVFVNGYSNNIITQYVNNVPVNIVNTDTLAQKQLLIQDDINHFVNLEVRGTEQNINEINPSELTAEADVSDIDAPGTYNVDVVVRGLQNTVILERVIPEKIQIRVDSYDTQSVKPVIITQGEPAQGKVVISATTDETVSLSGPSEQLNQIERVSGVVTVDGMTEDSRQFVTLKAYNADGETLNDVVCSPDTVLAQIKLGVTKEVPVEPPSVNDAPDKGYKITDVSVSPDKVVLAGSPEQLASISKVEVKSVNLPEGEKNASYKTESQLLLPGGIVCMDQKASVSVTVRIEQIVEKTYTVSTLTTTGLDPALKVVKISPGSLSLRVSGTVSELQKIDASKLKGVIDVSGKGAGTYNLPVKVEVNATVKSVSPSEAEVVLDKQ